MLTIFSIPKPFKGLAAIQQKNAIRSWLMLVPKCQVILCGDDPSVIDAATELGVESIPSIRCNEFGTPFLDSAFWSSYEQARFPLLCYVNSDIILLMSIIKAIARIRLNRFLAIGQRTNLDLTEPIDFEDAAWSSKLLNQSNSNGQLLSGFFLDYFIFTKNSNLHFLPPFLVGRPRWDNWLILNARILKTPIIDLTPVCQVIHQNHNYAHIPQWKGNSWNGPESEYNNGLYTQLIGKQKHLCNTKDSNYLLTQTFLFPALGPDYLFQRLQTSAILKPMLRPLARTVKSLYLRRYRSCQ